MFRIILVFLFFLSILNLEAKELKTHQFIQGFCEIKLGPDLKFQSLDQKREEFDYKEAKVEIKKGKEIKLYCGSSGSDIVDISASFPDKENKTFDLGSSYYAKIIIPGNGTLYIEHDDRFKTIQKFSIDFGAKQITEVKQPYLHIGQELKTDRACVSYKTTKHKEPVAYFLKNSPIEILLKETEKLESGLERTHLLVRSKKYRLLGWIEDSCSSPQDKTSYLCFQYPCVG